MITSNDVKAHFTSLHKTLHNLCWFQWEGVLGEGKKKNSMQIFCSVSHLVHQSILTRCTQPFFPTENRICGWQRCLGEEGNMARISVLLTKINQSMWTSKTFRTQNIHSTYTYVGRLCPPMLVNRIQGQTRYTFEKCVLAAAVFEQSCEIFRVKRKTK